MLIKKITKSYKQTQKLGEKFARYLLSPRKRGSRFKTWIPSQAGNDERRGALVMALHGNLGGGKTTFLQGFAKGLGVKEKILSPTYVIMKKFEIPPVVKNRRPSIFHYGYFYHIDCYRIKNEKDILDLDFKKIISNPKNIVAIEWPEKIKKVLPKDLIKIDFKFACPESDLRVDKNQREISI